MERNWHDSQKFHSQEDGSIIMELRVANLWEVKRWLIGWGADAHVIAPAELKKTVLQECRAMLST